MRLQICLQVVGLITFIAIMLGMLMVIKAAAPRTQCEWVMTWLPAPYYDEGACLALEQQNALDGWR